MTATARRTPTDADRESGLARRTDAVLDPDRGRVVARLFLPGEESTRGQSRAAAVVERVRGLGATEAAALASDVLSRFGARHRDLLDTLTADAAVVGAHLVDGDRLSEAQALVLGACFTAEYAVEGAALCNPSAVVHPDQHGLEPGALRVAVSLRAIGEGHVSSVGFAEAVIGPDRTWRFEPRARPAVAGTVSAGSWRRAHLRAVLADVGIADELSNGVLAQLPTVFDAAALQEALGTVPVALLTHSGSVGTLDALWRLLTTPYRVSFPSDVELSAQVLLPAVDEERNGIEDVRLVRFTTDDGEVEYRATYTAYDGSRIGSRLLVSTDLRTATSTRLAGPGARGKGMALFPRRLDGRYWSLSRSDGENISVTSSTDGLVWGRPTPLDAPRRWWELVQTGNCGSPIETARGWLVLTHGVGPLRQYALGAMLLDLEDPTIVLGQLPEPLLACDADEQDGYVPNVLYSCGGVVHDGTLWIPYGIGDSRIGVAHAEVDAVLAEMVPPAG